MHWVCPAGLFMGGPWLLLSEQVVFRYRAPPGWPVQERDQPALPAQHRPEESHLELHPLRDRNTVSCCLPALTDLPFFPPRGRRLELVCVHRYDDYDYGEVNQLLPRDLKLYIKAVACFPDANKTPVCPLTTSERVKSPAPLHLKPFFPGTWLDFHFFPPPDTRESADHGGPAAGRAAVRSESHHQVHDHLSARRDATQNAPLVPRDAELQGEQRVVETFWRTQSSTLHSSASWMFFLCSVLMNLHHGRPQPTSLPSLQTLEYNVQLFFYYCRTGFSLFQLRLWEPARF